MKFCFRVFSVALCFAVVVLSSSSKLFAEFVDFSATQNISAAGQGFDFTFDNLPQASNFAAVFLVHARGDFAHSRTIAGESLTWNLDNVVTGGPVGVFVSPSNSNSITSSVGGPFDFVIYNGGISDIEFQRSYQISGADIVNITADGTADISVDLGPNVGGGGFIEVELSYQSIPEPNSCVAFGIFCSVFLVNRKRTHYLSK